MTTATLETLRNLKGAALRKALEGLTPAELEQAEAMLGVKSPEKGGYARKKTREAARQAAQARTGRDCSAWIHPPEDPARKAEGVESFERFCLLYLGQTFSLNFSQDHLRAIGKIEQAVLRGGLFARWPCHRKPPARLRYPLPRASGAF